MIEQISPSSWVTDSKQPVAPRSQGGLRFSGRAVVSHGATASSSAALLIPTRETSGPRQARSLKNRP